MFLNIFLNIFINDYYFILKDEIIIIKKNKIK